MTCDHTIGVYCSDDGGPLRESEVESRGGYLKAEFLEQRLNPRRFVFAANHPERIDWTPRQFIEDDYEMFSFCPDCGAALK